MKGKVAALRQCVSLSELQVRKSGQSQSLLTSRVNTMFFVRWSHQGGVTGTFWLIFSTVETIPVCTGELMGQRARSLWGTRHPSNGASPGAGQTGGQRGQLVRLSLFILPSPEFSEKN